VRMRRNRASADTQRPSAEGSEQARAAAHQPWGDTLSRRRVAFVLVSVMLGMLLAALDQTVVGTAMPRIIGALNGMQHYAWVATGYLLASAASMPIWGKLSDAYGRRTFFIIGMVVFVAGSALCGQAHTMTELIAFRAFQGLGAGAMMPIVQAIIGDIFPPAQRAKWAGVLMSVFGFATIVGPLLGGWITDTIGWRWTFYVNLPVGLVALVFAAVALPGHVSLRRHRIDYAGSALLVAAAVPLLLGFSWAGSQYAWGSPIVIGLFTFSVAVWVAFFLWEMRAAEPVINPHLFTNSIFSVSAAASSLQSAAMFGAIMFLPLFVQGVLGKTATNSGIILMPLMIGAIVTSIGAGQILSRTGRYKILVICGFAAAGIGSYLLSLMKVDTSQFTLARDMVIMGLGLGIAMSAFTVIVQNQYPTYRLGEVTAGLQFFRSIGSTIGLAVFGTILNNRFASEMTHTLPVQLKGAAAKLDNPQVLVSAQARDQLRASFAKFGPQADQVFTAFMNAVRHSLDAAISSLFVLATIIGLVGLLTVLLLKEVPLRRTHSLVETAEEAAAEEAGVMPPPSVGDAVGPEAADEAGA
jgi:EmrB/QacA subfamily drug resistance transporter